MTFGKALDQIYGAQSGQRSRLRSHDTLRGTRQMRRRCEVEYRGDVPNVVPGILCELGRREQAHEIDDALEIGRALRRKRAAEMLARDTESGREIHRANATTGV